MKLVGWAKRGREVWQGSLLALAIGAIPSVSRGGELPERISFASLREEGFLPFPADVNAAGSPLGNSMLLNDEVRCDRACQDRIFREERLAYIPAGAHITVTIDSEDRENWDYPVGTTVAHPIWFRTAGRAQLFELRYVRKVGPDDWRFGMYAPPKSDPYSDTLELKNYEGSESRAYSLDLQQLGATRLSLKGIPLGSCQLCHFSLSTSAYQYASDEQAGPCGFGPANPGLRAAWTASYQKLRGYDPFTPRR